jgi:hypothetical protein
VENESDFVSAASYLQRQKRLVMKLRFSIALLIALAPVVAQAKPISGGGHMRPQLFHDRSPKPHIRTVGRARKTPSAPAKAQPPVVTAQPDEQ